ncbi:hypothetical protein [Kribbella sindirgiensis]|uniref:DUF4386 family protein n=1 Tax=Kribbella sindirgiensis TaxID=1124744 RepID=A0A4R0I872_9ACTN|nr:hypothetical protein [Kribbella sindirgiensis]TCC22382.1 hypothetical protein E0H50_34985 [Kribbella sindirgiensis]
MTVTATTLTRAAGAAAVAAGAIFIGVQIGHPHVDVDSIRTTELAVRNTLKLLMAALALVGITGLYLSQIRRNGVVGLIGYVVLAFGYLLIIGTTYVSGYVLPSIADTSPGYVRDVVEAATGGHPTGDIGTLGTILKVQGFAYLAGGLLLGIALFRARVLARWATVLLAVGGLVSAALAVAPDSLYRLLAYPNGIAMIALGYSLWRTTTSVRQPVAVGS